METNHTVGHVGWSPDYKSSPMPPVTGKLIARRSAAACSALLDLAIEWEAQAKTHDADGDADCGTGSDVPYALASMLRDHAKVIEAIAYANSPPNA